MKYYILITIQSEKMFLEKDFLIIKYYSMRYTIKEAQKLCKHHQKYLKPGEFFALGTVQKRSYFQNKTIQL
jgi:hypothetical protein